MGANLILPAGSAAADSTPAEDPVTRSLRFKDADNSALYFDPTASHDSSTVYTFSCWAKLGEMSAESYEIFTAGHYTSGSSQDLMYFGHNTDSKLRVWLRSTHDGTGVTYTSTAVFRDPSAWYHLLLVRNGASLKVYANNTEVISQTISSTQRYGVGSGYPMHIGSSVKHSYSGVSSYASFDGLLADVYFTDGYAKAPTDFIEDAGYGAYKPKAYTGSFGTNGFHIDAQPAHDADLLVTSVARNDGDTLFADAAKGHTVSTGGDPEHSIAVGNPFTGDGRAIYFDGTGDKIETGSDADFDFGTGDFTIECWFNPSSVSGSGSVWEPLLASNNYTSNGSWVLYQQYDDIYWRGYDGGTYANLVISSVLEANKWYHVAVTRESGTLKIYLNGEEVGSSSSFSSYDFDQSSNLRIGWSYNAFYYKGYMYDVRVVNGTAITPPSGGPTSKLEAVTNTKLLLQPDKDDSSWVDESGNQTLTGSGNVATVSPTASTPYDAAAKSTAMYFDGSADCLTTSTSTDLAIASGDSFTAECWVYINNLATNTHDGIFSGYLGSTNTGWSIETTNGYWGVYDSGGGRHTSSAAVTTGEWHHLALVKTDNTTNGARLYLNGNKIYDVTISSNLTSAKPITLGSYYASDGYSMDGYMFDARFTKGEEKYTGSTYTVPSAPFELNPVYLGGDQSGNKNHFTPTNISSHDVMLDTPTKNYATLNPVGYIDEGTDPTFAEGNLKITGGSADNKIPSTIAVSSGKWYAEVRVNATANMMMGVAKTSAFTVDGYYLGQAGTDDSWMIYRPTGNEYHNGSNSKFSSGFSTGDILQIALDLDNNKLWWGKNGTWEGTVGTSGETTITAGEYYFAHGYSGGTATWNFGQDNTFAGQFTGTPNNAEFAYEIPENFKSLNTSNLAAPTVTPSEHFDVLTYSGTGSSRSITGLDFQPALVWLKDRTTGGTDGWHSIHDSVRGDDGTHKYILSSDNTQITTDTTYSGYGVTSFNSDGFSILNGGSLTNHSSRNYVAWNWKAHQSPTSTRTTYTVKVEDSGGDAWDASSSFYDSSTYLPNVYMELWENRSSGLVSLGKVAVRSLDEGGNTLSETSEQTYELKCVDLNAITVKWHYDTSGDGQEYDYPNSYNDLLNEQKITILDGSTSEWTTNNSSNDDGGTNYNYSPPTGWANGDSLKTATTSYTGTDTATLTSNSGPVEKYNASAGFSIITYSGNGSSDGDTQEITHSLGDEPEFIIAKSRSSSASEGNWHVYHKHAEAASSSGYGTHAYLQLNQNYAATEPYYDILIPKSGSENTIINTVYNSSDSLYTNESGIDYVMYAWAGVEGYSKFGKYTGNASADGPFIYTGFRPAFVLIKPSSTSGGWLLFDSARDSSNPMNNTLYPHNSNAESGSGEIIDFYSSGFKIRGNYTDINSSGDTKIYAAFAEQPFAAPSNAK